VQVELVQVGLREERLKGLQVLVVQEQEQPQEFVGKSQPELQLDLCLKRDQQFKAQVEALILSFSL
jgi:uncharacterized protein YwbE